jgi:hypothetical protein
MGLSSELPLAVGSVPSVIFADPSQLVDLHELAGEEFPPELPVNWDWMLQPASRRSLRFRVGILAAVIVVLLIAVSLCVAYWSHRSSPSVLAAPISWLSA